MKSDRRKRERELSSEQSRWMDRWMDANRKDKLQEQRKTTSRHECRRVWQKVLVNGSRLMREMKENGRARALISTALLT